MSLLLKALEKAARDRAEAKAESRSEAPVAELALEPIEPERARAAGAQASQPEPAPRAQSAPEPARAATVLQAGVRTPGRGAAAYVRTHPLAVLGGFAALFLVGFAVYVYLQIYPPTPLVAQPPPASQPPRGSLAQAPAAPGPASAGGAADATSPKPLAAAPLLEQSASEGPAPAPPPAPARAKPPAEKEPQAAPPESPRDRIVVSRGDAEPAMHPLLPQAYAALRAERVHEAERLYRRLLEAEPLNVDALLGLAAAATLRGDEEEATRHYLNVLRLNPRHALAQSALLGLLGRADPVAAETRLHELLAREPSAFVYFTLGNLYADQSLWLQAQQAYFQAHHLEPANPDYAYNLAVALEHVNQPKLALGYYRRALELSARSSAHFDPAQAKERIGRLAAQVE